MNIKQKISVDEKKLVSAFFIDIFGHILGCVFFDGRDRWRESDS